MHEIIQPEGWPRAKGYSNGVLTSEGHLFVGGQIGWTEDQIFVAHDFVGQTEQALKNVIAVVERASGRIEHITRLTWYVTDKREYLARQKEVGEVYRRVMGRCFPAMTMIVVSGLVEDEALVEIEATAFIPR